MTLQLRTGIAMLIGPTGNRILRTSCLSIAVVTMLTVGCRDHLPRSLAQFDTCVAGGVYSLRQGEQRVQVECNLQEPLFLVGLPGRAITREELLTAGLSKELADMLGTSSLQGSRWCALEEFEYKRPTRDDKESDIPIATTNCLTTDVEIRTIVQSRASRLRVTLVRSPSGLLSLDSVESL